MGTHFGFYPVDRRNQLEIKVAEYVFEQTEPTPWAPLRKPLKECRAGVVTTAGLRLATQVQFDRARTHEYREISMYIRRPQIAYDFTNYDPDEAQKDLNVLVPLDRMRELVDDGRLAGLTETFFSFFGLCERIEDLKASAAEVADRMAAQGADVALLFPANLVCNQTAGLVARELERRGISTVNLAIVREIVEQVHVPRSVFVNFPFGRPLGRAGDKKTQRLILEEMLGVLKQQSRPGKIRDLPLAWEGELL